MPSFKPLSLSIGPMLNRFGAVHQPAKPKLSEAQRLRLEHDQLIQAEKLYYGLLEIMVAKEGPVEKQREIAGWLAQHEAARNELHTLLHSPKALPNAQRDMQYVFNILPLQVKLSALQRSPQVFQAYNTLSQTHKLIYDTCWLQTEEVLQRLKKTPRKLKTALNSLIGFYTTPVGQSNLDSRFKAFLTDWTPQFQPKKRPRP